MTCVFCGRTDGLTVDFIGSGYALHLCPVHADALYWKLLGWLIVLPEEKA
jgi:hypothetical protein